MKTFATCVTIGICLFSRSIPAEPIFFYGEIGSAPVFVSLDDADNKLSGWYLYIRQAKQIRLQGMRDASGFALDEFSFENGKKTGSFKGAASAAGWSGLWQSPNGRQLKFSLQPDRGSLSDLNGRVRCKTTASTGGYTYLNSLDLRAAAGRVTGISLSQNVTGWNDEQSCSIATSDLKQIPSGSGIVLRAKEDDEKDQTEGALHCSVNIIGSHDYLVLQVNGCKGAGDFMFCSARGSWADLIVDRKAQTCKAIQ